MSESRRWSWVWVPMLVLVLGLPGIVEAAARLIPPPAWQESGAAQPEAQRRASRWKDALGLQLTQVASSRGRDRFIETVAVFERIEPVSEDVLADEARAIAELGASVANIVGAAAPDEAAVRTIDSGERVIWARWLVDDLAYECVLAPSDQTATLIIASVLASELGEHRDALDRMVDQLEGVSAAMPKFSLLYWRIGSLLVWIALGVALHAGMLRIVDHDDDHATAGRRASLINLGFVLVGSLAAYSVLGERELGLVYAGSSVAGMTEWILVAGLIVVGAHYLLSSRMDRGVVQSAPSSGAFASGVYSRSDVIRVGSGVRPIPRDLARDLSSQSGSWVRNPAQQGQPSQVPSQEPSQVPSQVSDPAPTSPGGASGDARIYIDKDELE